MKLHFKCQYRQLEYKCKLIIEVKSYNYYHYSVITNILMMNKKLLVTLLFILLAGWIAGSCYWYVCKVTKNCTGELVDDVDTDDFKEVDSTVSIVKNQLQNKPTFSITDGDVVISENSTNISFNSGTAEIDIPNSMEKSLKKLTDFLNENPDKSIKINGLYANSDDSDALGISRANAMANYFKTKQGISEERIITTAKATDGLFENKETQKIIGGIEYEILSLKIDSDANQVEDTNKDVNTTNIKFDPDLKNKVDGRKIMYYPLTQFEVEPTYELEKYFKNLKKYFDQNPDGLVQITAHTEAKGDPSGSLYDSKKYAEKVKNYLISTYKMNPRNFRTKGQGDTKPVTDSDTNLGKAENRRIEFSFIK